MTLKDTVIRAFQNAAKNDTIFLVETDDEMLRTYYDPSGQRRCFMEHFGYGKPDPKTHPLFFVVRRSLTFENEVDKGKACAVLFTFDLGKIKEETHLEVRKNRVVIGKFIFTFRENVL